MSLPRSTSPSDNGGFSAVEKKTICVLKIFVIEDHIPTTLCIVMEKVKHY